MAIRVKDKIPCKEVRDLESLKDQVFSMIRSRDEIYNHKIDSLFCLMKDLSTKVEVYASVQERFSHDFEVERLKVRPISRDRDFIFTISSGYTEDQEELGTVLTFTQAYELSEYLRDFILRNID
jgi:hypothetical protein